LETWKKKEELFRPFANAPKLEYGLDQDRRERNVPTGEKNEKMKVETKRDFHFHPFEGWKEILSL
jgi:hypothetical protein